MWKYVTRRIRDTFERGANHFDKRHSAVINTSKSNLQEEKNKNSNSPCCWFMSRRCWNSFQSENDTNNKRWNFEQLNRTWIGAITWSSALVFGWYASQLIHLKCKKEAKINKLCYVPKISYLLQILPCLNHKNFQSLPSNLERSFSNVPPDVQLATNDHNTDSSHSSGISDASDELGEVLNSIENRLGLAAIENGQHQDGLSLLRSAANRNHPPAIYNLGLCYELGLGVEIDEKIAMELYRTAASLQHPGALYNLGIYYGQGRGGLSRDRTTAIRLLRLAAIQGQHEAIKALKSLEEPPTTQPDNDMEALSKHFSASPKHGNIVPTHSALFVEHVNTQSYNYQPLVF